MRKNVNARTSSAQYEKLEQALRDRLSKDNALYSLAERQFDKNIAEYFDSQALIKARKRFRRRCWMRKHLRYPVQQLTGKISRVAAKW